MKRYRKHILYILLIILISLFFLSPIINLRFYDSHDGEAHVARFAAYQRAFSDSHIPPRWAGFLNFGYGTPIFIFYYPLPGYIASLMYFTGMSFESIYVFLMISVFILAPVFFFLWLKQIFKTSTAFIGALLYGLMPYHFLNTYVRGDIAENMALVFVPLVFYFLEKYFKQNKLINIILGGISYALLILSHNGVSLMFSPVLFFYTVIRAESKKIFFSASLTFLIGLSISAFFWIPALYEGRYTNATMFIGNMFLEHFPTLTQLIYSPWGFGVDIRSKDALSVQVGILNLLLVILALLNIKKINNKKMLMYWFFVFIITALVTLRISSPIWENFSIIRLYEFPWRFVVLISYAAIVIGAIFINNINNKIFKILIVFVLLIYSFQFVKVKNYISYPDLYYRNFTGTTYYHGEANPVWTDGDPGAYPKSLIEVIGGDAIINNVNRKTQIITFATQSNKTSQFLVNTQYFPGWSVKSGDISAPIEFQDMNHRGLITFYLPPGKHDVKLEFKESPIRLLSNIISLTSIIIVTCLILWLNRQKKKIFTKLK